MALRISRPRPAEAFEQNQLPASTEPPVMMETASMAIPFQMISSRLPPVTARLIISAVIVGTSRAPVTSTVTDKSTIRHNFQ